MASTTTTIKYLLPVTRVRLQAIVQTITDTVLNNDKSTTTSFAFSLVTSADPDRSRTLSVKNGWLSDYSFQIGLTEDGRLTEAGVGSTGQLATVLAAGVTVAVAAAGVLTGSLPALAGAGAAAVGTAKHGERILGPHEQEPAGAQEQAPVDPVWEKYREQHPTLAARLHDLRTERDATVKALDQARKDLRIVAGDPTARYSRQQEVTILTGLLTDLDADLDEANTHFNIWRQGTLTTTVRSYDELLSLNELPPYENGAPVFGTASNAASGFYAATGRILATVGYDGTAVEVGENNEGAQQTDTTALSVLRPRPVVLAHIERTDEDDQPDVTGFDRVLVMDAGSEEMTVPVRKSLWAKRRTDLSLSELGAMTKVSYNGTSAAAASQALAGVPGKVSSGLEQAAKINKELEEIRARPDHSEADKAKTTKH